MAKSKETPDQKAERLKEEQEKKAELDRAVGVYEDLLVAADGGDAFEVGEFESTTIIAMLKDHRYRKKVIDAHTKEHG